VTPARPPYVRDALLIVAVVLGVRSATFFTQVVDWDVGFYLVIAREVLHGHLPYVTAWEYRPPGLFFLLAAALGIFRTPALAMGVLGALGVFATSLALYVIGTRFTRDGRTLGLIAALLYATISIEDDGLAANTEILFAPFVCWALAVVLRVAARDGRIAPRTTLLTGLLLGCALQMKLMVAPEAAFVLALAATIAQGGAAALIAGSVAALMPFALAAAVYAYFGALPQLYDANLGASLRRAGVSTTAPRDNLQRILAQPLALAPATILALLSPYAFVREPRGSPDRRLALIVALWLAVEALTIMLVREFNDHQFLQLVPPLALLAGFLVTHAGLGRRAVRVLAALTVLVSFALHGYYQVRSGALLAYHRAILGDATWREANVDRIAAVIRSEPEATRTLFVVGETPIVYLLADAPIPTRFPFPLYLTDPEMWPLTGVDGRDEVARIVAARPTFVLRSDSRFHLDPQVAAEVDAALRAVYQPVGTFEHDTLYRLRDAAAARGTNSSLATSSSEPGYSPLATRT
jgi:dolichyl-phosphate-mannose-protein mannosyltransferase